MSSFFARPSPSYLHDAVEKLIFSAAHIFPGFRAIVVMFNFTLALLIIFHAACFSDTDRVVYYLEFSAAIFNTKSLSG